MPSALTPLSAVWTPATRPSSQSTRLPANPGRSITSTPGISRASIWAAIQRTIRDRETIGLPWLRRNGGGTGARNPPRWVNSQTSSARTAPSDGKPRSM